MILSANESIADIQPIQGWSTYGQKRICEKQPHWLHPGGGAPTCCLSSAGVGEDNAGSIVIPNSDGALC